MHSSASFLHCLIVLLGFLEQGCSFLSALKHRDFWEVVNESLAWGRLLKHYWGLSSTLSERFSPGSCIPFNVSLCCVYLKLEFQLLCIIFDSDVTNKRWSTQNTSLQCRAKQSKHTLLFLETCSLYSPPMEYLWLKHVCSAPAPVIQNFIELSNHLWQRCWQHHFRLTWILSTLYSGLVLRNNLSCFGG